MTVEEKIKHVESALKKQNELNGIICKLDHLKTAERSLQTLRKQLENELKELLLIQHKQKEKVESL